MKRLAACLAALASMLIGSGSFAQFVPATEDWPVAGLRAKLGASVAKVQASYGIAEEPKPGTHRADQSQLEVASEGLLFTFNASKCLTSIRLAENFAGRIAGISMRDKLAAITARLDQPVRQPLKSGQEKAYVYDIAPAVAARFDVSLSGEIKRVYLTWKREAGEPACGADS